MLGKKKKKTKVAAQPFSEESFARRLLEETPGKATPFSIQIGSMKFPLIAILGVLVIAGILFTRRD